MRPGIAIAAPDGTAQTGLRLDDTFAMHPALAPLLPLLQQGVLGCVPAPNRSHFEAQYQMEISQTGKTSRAPGWLNKIAGLPGTQAVAGQGKRADAAALGVGEANPAILGGPAAVKLIARGPSAERSGVLANDNTRQALLDLYAGNDSLDEAFSPRCGQPHAKRSRTEHRKNGGQRRAWHGRA